MLTLSDGLHPRRFPIVNVALIAANFAVWMLYELPHLDSAVYHASFYSCTVDNACHGPEPWQISWFTAMFMHGSWSHILGNMLFLAIFVQIPAWVYLGGWFVYQLVEGHAGLTSASASGDGVAFFAHIGGFAFGALVTLTLLNAGRVVPQSTSRHSALAPV